MKACKIKILLVDDDLKNSMFLKRFLEAKEYEVIYANNGCVAWELYTTENPDLVLLDINMPEMGGFELAQKIRERNLIVLIFFLTDRTEQKDRIKGFDLKGNDYITKPFYPEELIARIEERFEYRAVEVQSRFTLNTLLFDCDMSILEQNGKVWQLSVRQTEILRMLVLRMGQMVLREDILKSVWGNISYANSLALNVQISYLRKFLQADASISILAVKKRGYVFKLSTDKKWLY